MPSTKDKTASKPGIAPYLLLAIISLALYANTLTNEYAIDDGIMLTKNHFVQQGISGIPTLLRTTHMQGFSPNIPYDDYRPLSLIAFAIEYQVFGLNPVIFHLANVLLFMGCVLVLFRFLQKISSNNTIAFAAALLFAVHPIHTDVVANIKSSDELWCFLFAFLSLLAFSGYASTGKWYQLLIGSAMLFLSVLSKQTVLTFAAVIPLVFFCYFNENKTRSVIVTCCSATVFALFFFISSAVLRNNNPDATFLPHQWVVHLDGRGLTVTQNLITDMMVLGTYLRVLLFPYPLIVSYTINMFPAAGTGVLLAILSFLLYAGMTGLAIFRLIKYPKDRLAFGLLFYIITISLFSNILFLPGEIFSARFAFFASVGVCYVLALAIYHWLPAKDETAWTSFRSKPALVLIPVLLCLSAITIARNPDWKNDSSLVAADLRKAPNNPWLLSIAAHQLMAQYDDERDSLTRLSLFRQAAAHYSSSIHLSPDNADAYSGLGIAYFKQNIADSAEYCFRHAIELDSSRINIVQNLANLYFRSMRLKEAITWYHKGLKIAPSDTLSWYNMGICYAWTGQNDSSIFCNKKTLSLSPAYDHYKAFGNIAILYAKTGQQDSAHKYEVLTQQYYPSFHL